MTERKKLPEILPVRVVVTDDRNGIFLVRNFEVDFASKSGRMAIAEAAWEAMANGQSITTTPIRR